MMKKIVGFLIVLIIVYLGYLGYDRYVKEKQPKGLQAAGTIEATQVELRAKVAGTLQGLTISAGDSVKKDQQVASIIRNDLAAQRERDALAVDKARTQLDDLISGARDQEIREAQIAVETAQFNYDNVAKDFERASVLFAQSVISEAEMENVETAFKQAQNSLESSMIRLNLLQAGSRPDQIEAARVELERSIAVLKAAEALSEDTKIICPIEGTVLNRNFENGEVIQAGASVASVANLNDMWIKIYIPTDDLPKIVLGQQVKFTVSGSDEEYSGIIEEIASSGEYTPKVIQTKKERTNIVFAVRIKINNENNVLKPGMPADVVLD
jgi:HlyD family secretion protein